MLIIGQPTRLILGSIERISGVSPEFENIIARSSFVKRPISPCNASDGWRKKLGTPMLANVADVFIATKPALPIPHVMTCP